MCTLSTNIRREVRTPQKKQGRESRSFSCLVDLGVEAEVSGTKHPSVFTNTGSLLFARLYPCPADYILAWRWRRRDRQCVNGQDDPRW
jgi:hypothetical protein